jgi:hypothetical protein
MVYDCKNIIRGGWSEKELWFDLPDVFTNFVIEIMHTSIVEWLKTKCLNIKTSLFGWLMDF